LSSALKELSLQETERRTSALVSPTREKVYLGDQDSDKMLTFDLSIPILKRLITGSQSLYRKVQRDANWASRCQLSVNDQSLVVTLDEDRCSSARRVRKPRLAVQQT
jgi:hypothetical protein